MKFEYSEVATSPIDDKVNDAQAFLSGTLACVVTGMSDGNEELQGKSNTARFVEQIAVGIRSNASKWNSLTRVLDAAVESAKQIALERGMEWTSNATQSQLAASVAMLRVGPKQLDYLVLGPSTIVIAADGRALEVITDDRALPFRQRVVDFINEMQSTMGMSYGEASLRAVPLLRRTRDVMNTPEGFYSLTPSKEGLYQAITGSVSYSSSCKVMVSSEGFSRCVDLFHNASWTDVLDPNYSLSTSISNLREAETRDFECREKPRLNVSKSAAVVKFSVTRGESRRR